MIDLPIPMYVHTLWAPKHVYTVQKEKDFHIQGTKDLL